MPQIEPKKYPNSARDVIRDLNIGDWLLIIGVPLLLVSGFYLLLKGLSGV